MAWFRSGWPSVPAGAASAATERPQRRVRIEALAPVHPRHAQPVRLLADRLGPGHLLRERSVVADTSIRIVQAQAIERIDAPVAVGPRHADRVAPDQMDVLLLRVRQLASQWQVH